MIDSLQSRAAATLAALFGDYDGPPFSIALWNGWSWQSSRDLAPACTILVATPKALRTLTLDASQVALGEAFIDKQIEIEGDLFAVFPVVEHLLRRPLTLRQRILRSISHAMLGFGRRLTHGPQHSARRDRSSIAYHYDQPFEFFRPWLGPTLAYSCAYFQEPSDSLDEAQEQKFDLICRKLRLEPGERFLDIGCGWGSLILHAARQYRADAYGITISREQADAAEQRIRASGLSARCQVQFQDYRALVPAGAIYDKIASVGMCEHVGLRNLPAYFSIAHRVLRPGGVFLNHGIARAVASVPRGQDSFIARYVFPDSHLVTLTQAIEAAESAGFEVRDVENLREHYELTLRRWVQALRQCEATILQHVPEITYRIWLLYMAGSAAAFRSGSIGVYQVLLSRPVRGASRLPLTRDDWYRPALSERNRDATFAASRSVTDGLN